MYWKETVHQIVTNMSYQKITTAMNMSPIMMTNPADSQYNHSSCAGKRGLGRTFPNKQSAKGATFALLATMLRGRFQESMEPCSRKKEISFRENFWSGKPSKTVISGNLTDAKMSAKPYAATLSEVFKT